MKTQGYYVAPPLAAGQRCRCPDLEGGTEDAPDVRDFRGGRVGRGARSRALLRKFADASQGGHASRWAATVASHSGRTEGRFASGPAGRAESISTRIPRSVPGE